MSLLHVILNIFMVLSSVIKLNYFRRHFIIYLCLYLHCILGEFWFCKNDLFWLLHLSKDPLIFKVMDSNRMTCGGYKYIGKPVIPVLRLLSVCYIDNLIEELYL